MPTRSRGSRRSRGWASSLVSAAVLFVLTRRYLDRAERTTEMLEEAYEQTLAGWAAALDIRDHSTGEHTARVTELTVALAERFGIERRRAGRHPARRDPARHRQDGGARRRAGEGRAADRRRLGAHPAAPRHGSSDAAGHRLPRAGASTSRGATTRSGTAPGIPRGLAGHRHPVPREAVRRRRRVRRPDVRTSLPRADDVSRRRWPGSSPRQASHFDPDVVGEFVDLMLERQAEGQVDEGGRL